MSYQRKRQLLFSFLAVIIVLSWSPLRANFSDGAVFTVVLLMIFGGYWAIERLIGKATKATGDD